MGYENLAGSTALAPGALHIQYRGQFPVTQNLIYLNHAAVGPLSLPAAEAMKNLVDDVCLNGSLHYGQWLEAYSGLRKAAATMLNASPDEIAIVKNTSEGIAMVAMGIEWKAGDRVIVFQEEFPANLYPWRRLERQGVQLTWLSIYDEIEEIAETLPGAKLLAISFVNYLSGFRVDLPTIGELCHESGCLFFVDAIQGMGVLPIDVERCHIDALAADGHKWMVGPEGNGILYVRGSRLDEIEPVEFGWTNPKNYADYSSRDMTLRPDAGRYECGTLNTAGCFGQRASLELLLEAGIGQIAANVLALGDQIDEELRHKGYEVIIERKPGTSSGIVSFRNPSTDSRQIVSDLRHNKVAAAARGGWVRVAPHFYLSPGDIESFLRLLPRVR